LRLCEEAKILLLHLLCSLLAAESLDLAAYGYTSPFTASRRAACCCGRRLQTGHGDMVSSSRLLLARNGIHVRTHANDVCDIHKDNPTWP